MKEDAASVSKLLSAADGVNDALTAWQALTGANLYRTLGMPASRAVPQPRSGAGGQSVGHLLGRSSDLLGLNELLGDLTAGSVGGGGGRGAGGGGGSSTTGTAGTATSPAAASVQVNPFAASGGSPWRSPPSTAAATAAPTTRGGTEAGWPGVLGPPSPSSASVNNPFQDLLPAPRQAVSLMSAPPAISVSASAFAVAAEAHAVAVLWPPHRTATPPPPPPLPLPAEGQQLPLHPHTATSVPFGAGQQRSAPTARESSAILVQKQQQHAWEHLTAAANGAGAGSSLQGEGAALSRGSAGSAMPGAASSSGTAGYLQQNTGGSAYQQQSTGGSTYQQQNTGGSRYPQQYTGGGSYQQQYTGGSASPQQGVGDITSYERQQQTGAATPLPHHAAQSQRPPPAPPPQHSPLQQPATAEGVAAAGTGAQIDALLSHLLQQQQQLCGACQAHAAATGWTGVPETVTRLRQLVAGMRREHVASIEAMTQAHQAEVSAIKSASLNRLKEMQQALTQQQQMQQPQRPHQQQTHQQQPQHQQQLQQNQQLQPAKTETSSSSAAGNSAARAAVLGWDGGGAIGRSPPSEPVLVAARACTASRTVYSGAAVLGAVTFECVRTTTAGSTGSGLGAGGGVIRGGGAPAATGPSPLKWLIAPPPPGLGGPAATQTDYLL